MGQNKIKVTIVEDHQLFREGVKLILNNLPTFEVVADFYNGKEFLDHLSSLETDVVLMDIAMPVIDGTEATRLAIEQKPDIKILALSMHGEESYYFKMIQAGARGFVLKQTNSDELVDAITKVANGENYFSQELLRKIIFNQSHEAMSKLKGNSAIPEISEREMEILQLICQGLTNAEIADTVFLSQRTIEGHRANLIKKTDTKNTVQLIMFALKNGIVKI